jgi:NitT/TauT family transport system permease protein
MALLLRRLPPRRLTAPVAAALLVVAAWWSITATADVPTVLLPAPPDLGEAFGQRHRYLLGEAAATLGHTLGGFATAGLVSVTIALLLTICGVLRDAVWPLLVVVQVVPTVAVAPMVVVWVGYGLEAKLVLVTLVAFFPMIVNAVAGLRSTPQESIDLARSLRASPWQTLIKIRVPHALPQVFTGLKIGITLALIGAVIAELTTPNAGLGMVILRAGQAADTPTAFVAFALLGVIGIGCYFSVVGLERLVVPWARTTT